MKKYIVPVSAIAAILILELAAIFNGVNGATLAGTIAIVAGIGGYTVGSVRKSK